MEEIIILKNKNAKLLDGANLLKIISNPIRLEIICYLENGEMYVSQLLEKFPKLSQPAISQHLALLKMHKVVRTEKQGQHVAYSLKDENIHKLINSLRKVFS